MTDDQKIILVRQLGILEGISYVVDSNASNAIIDVVEILNGFLEDNEI